MWLNSKLQHSILLCLASVYPGPAARADYAHLLDIAGSEHNLHRHLHYMDEKGWLVSGLCGAQLNLGQLRITAHGLDFLQQGH